MKELSPDSFSFVTKKNRMTMTRLEDESYEVSCSEKEWHDIWHHYFDLDTCYKDIRASIPQADSFLASSAKIGKGIRILNQDKFEMLISFIISQRKSIPAIKTSVERLCSLYGEDGFFPTPDALSKAGFEDLSSCGLGYRVPYIMEASKRVARGDVDLDVLDKLSDEELFNELKSFKGVGDKVANCVALFAYHRVGRAPIDTWIKKIIDTEYKGVDPFSSYGKYAGIMQQYMFYGAQHMKMLTSK